MVYMIWQDQGAREYMEDRISIVENIHSEYSYYGVFDGHGGQEVAEYLATNFKTVLKELLVTKGSDSNQVHTLLFDAFQKIVNDIPYAISMFCGSTAVVVLRNKDNLWVANCGDTRAVMNSGKDAVTLSQDHKPMRPDEHKRITSLGGTVAQASRYDVFRVNGVLAVSRSIGDFMLAPYVTWKPEITHFQLHENVNNYVVIATDGIWDALTGKDVVSVINESFINDDARNIGNNLITASRERGSGDNIAICLILL